MSPKARDSKHNPSRRVFIGTAALGSLALTGFSSVAIQNNETPNSGHWDNAADVVVVGAGATGLPAAIEAAEQGASVIVIDANWDVGGHAILSAGNLALGG